MKTILLSTVALVGFAAGAMAADLPVRAAPPPPVVAAIPVFTWTGFYVGVNGGVAFGDEDDRRGNNRRFHHHHHRLVEGDGIRDTVRRNRRDRNNGGGNDDISPLGGGQIGYNMQFGLFVAGIEADIQAIDFQDLNDRNRHRHHRPGDNNGGNNGLNGRNNGDSDGIDAFGTVRGRLGLAAFDRGLIYATGGLAWKSDGENGRGDNVGFTVGGGFEYAFTNSISFKVEGLYVDFSEDDNRNGRNGNRNRRNNDNDFGDNNFGGNSREFGLVRAGVNFRFNTF